MTALRTVGNRLGSMRRGEQSVESRRQPLSPTTEIANVAI